MNIVSNCLLQLLRVIALSHLFCLGQYGKHLLCFLDFQVDTAANFKFTGKISCKSFCSVEVYQSMALAFGLFLHLRGIVDRVDGDGSNSSLRPPKCIFHWAFLSSIHEM